MADETKPAAAQRRKGSNEAGVRIEHPTVGSGERSETLKDAHEKGYFGEKVDPTPNEHYTAPDPHTSPPPFTGPDVK